MSFEFLRGKLSRALLLALIVLGLARPTLAPAQAVSNEFWQGQSIYQIITDRFFDGDASNNNAEGNYNASGTTSVHGGDFKGIEQKLDYLKALGVTAIWISPIVKNGNGQFHGYAGSDFYQVAPHWGSLADLQHMIQACHSRGILVVNDIVVNHGDDLIYSTDAGWSAYRPPTTNGYNLIYRNASKKFAAPFNTNSLNPNLTNIFHNNGAIPNYDNPQPVELGELSGLDDFRTESDYVRSNMVAIYNYWIAQGFDGFRVDTVKHVEMGFWQTWSPLVHAYAATQGKSNFFMFGEVYDGSDSKCGSYTGVQGGGAFKLDSVVDYPLYFKISSVFASASGNTKQIEDRYSAIPSNYDADAQMRLVTFLDNHDQPRFLNASGATTARLDVALAFLYTSRGVPCLYYGTEQAFNGATDPNDREDMFDGQFEQGPSLGDNFNMTHPQFQKVAMLNNFRRLYPALRTGSHVNKWNNPSGPGLFAYSRRLGNQEVFVVLNTSTSSQTLTNRSTILPAGTPIVNLFDTNEVLTVTATPETPPIVMPGTSAKIFVAQSDWQPLDPVVVSNSPPHDSTNSPTAAPIVLRFSKAMDTNTVQSAFVTTPSVSGTFSWSAARDTMTFIPNGSGFPTLTTVTVRVTNAIDTVSGNAMFSPYELKFKTSTNSFVDTVPPTVTLQTPTNNTVATGNLAISGTATDNIGVQKVEVRLDAGSWLTASGTINWSLTLNTSNFLNGLHTLSVRASDAAANVSTTNSISLRFINQPGAYVQRVAAGNTSNITDCVGSIWPRDTNYTTGAFGYSGGSTGYLGNTITGICPSAQSLYQRERYGNFSYQFDCPIGVYETTLLESETYWSAAGQRVFNISIQGSQVVTNLDIFAVAGGKNLPLSLVYTNSVTNGQMLVTFTSVVDSARVSGIQLRKIADVFSDTDGIPDWWRLAYYGHALGQAGDNSRASDDADGDGAPNIHEYLAGTDPLNPASIFKVTQTEVLGTDVQVSCLTVTTRTYQLQRRNAFDDVSVWTDVGTPVGGTGGVIILTDLGGAANSTQLYRVKAN